MKISTRSDCGVAAQAPTALKDFVVGNGIATRLRASLLAAIGVAATLSPVLAQFTNLHSFTGVGDGAYPRGSLTASGTRLYGMTAGINNFSYGTVFAMNMDGSGYTNLHVFASGSNDGARPFGSLVLGNATLYGMTESGGSIGNGVMFKINVDGSGFAILHDFGLSQTTSPDGSLALSGSTLYGMTYGGGTFGDGTVFKIKTNGSGFAILHSFSDVNLDGAFPESSLIVSGTTLYGMTSGGGTNGNGVVFKMNTDGGSYTTLHAFTGVFGDGASPGGNGLTLSGTNVYGMTAGGGINGDGVVFKINANGSGYTSLYSFGSGNGSGAGPNGDLTLNGTTLYGMTVFGGRSSKGVVFQMNTQGTGYTNLYTFTGVNGDGAFPYGSLILTNMTVFGMTYSGGASNFGTVFSLSLSPPPPPLRPQLSIICSGADAVLTWPTNDAGFTLQSTTSLVSPTVWSTNSSSPVIVNGQYSVTSPVSGTPRFFRLSH